MRTIKDIDLENKKVIVRVDYNVPIKDGKITSDNRIRESLETIEYLQNKNCKIILLSHLGKVKSEEDKKNNSLKIVSKRLGELLNQKIYFCPDTRGFLVEEMIKKINPRDILMIENTRYEDVPDKLESNCDESLSEYWSTLGEVFILDAFGSAHRAHASTYGISKYLPHAIGFLIQKEIKVLEEIINENKNLILGGAKVSDKIGVIENLLPKTNKVLIGGAMCATFLKASGYEVGKTFVDEERIEYTSELIKTNKIVLPVDVVTESGIKELNEITSEDAILDIGPKTVKLFTENLDKNIMVVMNGTMGLYEDTRFKNGTDGLFKYLLENNIKTIICGGDTGSAAEPYKDKFYHISTGGGASLEYLEGKILPALEIMEK